MKLTSHIAVLGGPIGVVLTASAAQGDSLRRVASRRHDARRSSSACPACSTRSAIETVYEDRVCINIGPSMKRC